MGKRIAVLMACYNRVQTTMQCLQFLFESELPPEFALEVFLVDDNSPDETGKIVKLKYPYINVIRGQGDLFWAKGMRLAWEYANRKREFDYFLWLNDDTMLFKHALLELLEVNKIHQMKNKLNISFGFCCSPLNKNLTTYGALNNRIQLKPNGSIQVGNLINGNLVLVPCEVFARIGNISDLYTHGIADYDYSLRATNQGIDCISSRIFVAECSRNTDYFTDKSNSIFKRFVRIYNDINDKSSKIYFSEFLIFRKLHFNESNWLTYTKYVFSKIYQILNNI